MANFTGQASLNLSLSFRSNGAAMEFAMLTRDVGLITQSQFEALVELYATQKQDMLENGGNVHVDVLLK